MVFVGIFLRILQWIKIIKYYSYVLVFYTAAIIAFFILKNLFDYIYLLNFGLRVFFVATSSFFMRRDIFKNGKNFYPIFFVIALINPLFSSLILGLFQNYYLESILLSKFLADLIVSIFSYCIIDIFDKKS